MIARLKKQISLAALAAIFAGTAVQAQDWPNFLETKQLFRVIVKGIGQAGTALQPVKGTAWAVAPGVLITADHVTGKAQNYQNASRSDKVFIPRRDVSVEVSDTKIFSGSGPQKYPGGIVTPSPFESIDAARIGFTELRATPFALTACEIEPNTAYRVLKFNDGNVFQPTPVTIQLKAYGRSELGDAGSVVVMTGQKGTIEEGDSGSPVLGPDNRVTGLVSAINADSGSDVRDEVHVTLVRSFLDLIPLHDGETELLDIPCSERIWLREVDSLRGELVEANSAIDTQIAQLEKMGALLSTVKDQNEVQAHQINTLLRNQLRLAVEAERSAGNAIDVPEGAEMPIFDENIVLWEKGKNLFDLPLNRAPLRPTVSRISSALGNPKWTLRGRVNTGQDVSITLSYDRTLSGPPHSLNMYFCFRPIHWDIPGETPVRDNPTNAKYYEKYDGPFEELSAGLTNNECEKISHTARNAAGTDPNSITKGYYNWALPASVIRRLKGFHDSDYPNTNWNGVYYLQIFEPAQTSDTGKEMYQLRARAIIDVVKDAGEASVASGLPCQYFEISPAKTGDLDKLASGDLKLEEDEICAQDI